MKLKTTKLLTASESMELLDVLKDRFRKNVHRHKGIEWLNVEKRLQTNMEKLWSLNEMQKTGGEPDVVGYDSKNDEYIFYDCSPESPKGRRSLCYDMEALNSRKENKPKNSAIGMAIEMGIEILSESNYRELQKLENFDTKTSSWVYTPPDIRAKGGAIFCDYRFGHTWVYHNGAESYYADRGFRGSLMI
jgi:hypothetical protein